MGDSDKVGFRHMVPGLFNGFATALTAAAGLIGVLYQTGYLGNRAALRAGVAAKARAHLPMPDETQLAAVASPPAPGPLINGGDDRAAPAVFPKQKNLSGAWRDAGSNCHQVVQVGHALTVTSYFANNGRLWAVGSGTVKGRVIAMRMNSANPASPEADLVLSGDGRELSGMITGVKGAHVAMWRFVGPSCLQTASPK